MGIFPIMEPSTKQPMVELPGCRFFNQQSEWLTDFAQAQKISAEKKESLLLNFSGSDWCGPCIRMKQEIFDSEHFKKYANGHLVLVNADFPRNKKNKLSKELEKQN